MVNPKKIMQVKEMAEGCMRNHAKLQPFFNAAMNSLEEGSIIEISVKSPEGRELCTNLRVNREDMQLFREIQAMNVNP
ncbi:MAG: hypothetical protein PUI42_00650 [Lachnospiraceae bacterium]|nr:hypothetical protein [Lachnospiraceae bacterium]